MRLPNKFYLLSHKIVSASTIFMVFFGPLGITLNLHASDSVTFKIAIISTAQCFNGLDDDFDGLIDTLDSGCTGPTDNQELTSDPGPTSGGG